VITSLLLAVIASARSSCQGARAPGTATARGTAGREVASRALDPGITAYGTTLPIVLVPWSANHTLALNATRPLRGAFSAWHPP
jgi:hypothetical protein